MLMRLWIWGIIVAIALCELSGDHICEIEESYPVNVTEYSWRNATVRNYKWCMGFPPRCSFYTFKTVKVPQIVEQQETRIIRKCCPGYAENKNRNACVPCGECFEGLCGYEGKCFCKAGFQGDECSKACEPMRWGAGCTFNCLCERGSCDPRTGKCDCPSGWFGTRCELLCLEGFYGKHCINRCSCGERGLCSPQTGECLKKSTYHQERHSTRAIHYMTKDVLNITQFISRHRSTPTLQKYYTFDMELNSTKPIYSGTMEWTTDKITVNKNEKYKTTPKYITSTLYEIPNMHKNWSKVEINSTRKTHTATGDSVESTTEISVEVDGYEEIPIINENGSLEKQGLSEINDKVEINMDFKENVPPTINSVPQTTKNVIPSNENNSSRTSKTMRVNSSAGDNISTVPFPANENGSFKTKKTHKPLSKSKDKQGSKNHKHSNKSNDPTIHLRKTIEIYKNSAENSFEINSNDRSQPSKEIRKNPGTYSTTEGSSKEILTSTRNILLETTNKDNSAKIFNKNNGRNSTINRKFKESVSKIIASKSKIDGSSDTHTTVRNNQEKLPHNKIYPGNPFVPPKPSTDDDKILTDSFVETTGAVNTKLDYLANIPQILKSTPSISRSGKSNDENEDRNMEDDTLQNLDTLNILTSRETSTPFAALMTTMESLTFKKQGVLPFTEATPGTKIFNNMGNDLSTAESTENGTPVKEAFDSSRSKEENYLSDEASGEFEYSSTNKSNLGNHMTIAALITFILVIVMSALISAHHYARKRRKRKSKLKPDHQHYQGGPTVSVYTHSIFHTPLPEPPTFENPVFVTPTENSGDHRTFQTHVVCSMNFPGPNRPEEKEYTYDHPPSTGSYRAASIPEPPDFNDTVAAEPVYDEIPSNVTTNLPISLPPSYKSPCIYVNTCGKTRL